MRDASVKFAQPVDEVATHAPTRIGAPLKLADAEEAPGGPGSPSAPSSARKNRAAPGGPATPAAPANPGFPGIACQPSSPSSAERYVAGPIGPGGPPLGPIGPVGPVAPINPGGPGSPSPPPPPSSKMKAGIGAIRLIGTAPTRAPPPESPGPSAMAAPEPTPPPPPMVLGGVGTLETPSAALSCASDIVPAPNSAIVVPTCWSGIETTLRMPPITGSWNFLATSSPERFVQGLCLRHHDKHRLARILAH